MYNRLYNYLIEDNILYSKQFSFQNGHSTHHAVVQLVDPWSLNSMVDQIIESFENNKYTLGVFIDLSKAFDTVDHSIHLKKLKCPLWYNGQKSWMAQKLPLKWETVRSNQ